MGSIVPACQRALGRSGHVLPSAALRAAMQTALLILPNFVLILAGLVLARRFGYGGDFWAGLEKLVYFVLFPALLFRTLALATLDLGSVATMLACGAGITLLAMALAALARPLFRADPRTAASCFQCAFRFNSYIGLAVAGSVFGPPGIALTALLFGAMIPMVNIAAVSMLAAHARGNPWAELIRNPLVLSTVAGLVWGQAGLPLPRFADQTLHLLGQSALPAGLLAVGAALRIEGMGEKPLVHGWWLAIKLLLMPAGALACAHLFPLPPNEAGALVAWAALPTAASAYILAVRMGGDGPAVAAQITASTLLSMLTLPVWIALAR